jgi:hypothetical protein
MLSTIMQIDYPKDKTNEKEAIFIVRLATDKEIVHVADVIF